MATLGGINSISLPFFFFFYRKGTSLVILPLLVPLVFALFSVLVLEKCLDTRHHFRNFSRDSRSRSNSTHTAVHISVHTTTQGEQQSNRSLIDQTVLFRHSSSQIEAHLAHHGARTVVPGRQPRLQRRVDEHNHNDIISSSPAAHAATTAAANPQHPAAAASNAGPVPARLLPAVSQRLRPALPVLQRPDAAPGPVPASYARADPAVSAVPAAATAACVRRQRRQGVGIDQDRPPCGRHRLLHRGHWHQLPRRHLQRDGLRLHALHAHLLPRPHLGSRRNHHLVLPQAQGRHPPGRPRRRLADHLARRRHRRRHPVRLCRLRRQRQQRLLGLRIAVVRVLLQLQLLRRPEGPLHRRGRLLVPRVAHPLHPLRQRLHRDRSPQPLPPRRHSRCAALLGPHGPGLAANAAILRPDAPESGTERRSAAAQHSSSEQKPGGAAADRQRQAARAADCERQAGRVQHSTCQPEHHRVLHPVRTMRRSRFERDGVNGLI